MVSSSQSEADPRRDGETLGVGLRRRLLVVEDDPVMRGLLGTVLCPSGWEPVLAASGTEALAHLCRETDIRVALVDLGLPDMDGVKLIEQLSATHASVPVVVLTVCTEERRILDAFRAGARGYLFKEDLAHLLAPALEEAMLGGAPMSRTVARLVLAQLQGYVPQSVKPTVPVTERPNVTERERQVIEQLARGLSYTQVGSVLDISSNTVRSYIRTIYDKLAVCSKTEAVLVALRLGILGDEPERGL